MYGGSPASASIIGGYNVYPLEIEEVLDMHPAIETSAVVSAPDSDWGERVIAFIVPAAGAVVEEAVFQSANHHRDRL